MAKNIIAIDGSKGGVGKSAVAQAVIDTLQEQGKKILLIESDTSNPDVLNCYEGIVETIGLKLDVKEGWIALLNAVHGTDATVVLNAGARNDEGIANYGTLLMTALPELNCPFITLWVINRQRYSLEALRTYRKTMKSTALHVVRNLHWGSPEKFELFNGSDTKIEVEADGGLIIDFPDVADRVADAMCNNHIAICNAVKELPFGEKIELQRWRAEVWKALGPVL